MKFCTKCGAELSDDVKFCQACGQACGENVEAKAEESANKVGDAVAKFVDTNDETGNFDAADISANKILAALSYLGVLVLIPILAAPNSKFAKYHVNQGLVLFIASLLVNIVSFVVSFVVGFIAGMLEIPFITGLVSALFGLINFVLFIFAVLGIVYALQGKAKELPLFGRIKLWK